MLSSIDKVYVINLKSRTDRRKLMKENLRNMGIPARKIEFVEATTRDKSSWDKALKEIGRTRKDFLSPSVSKKLNSKKVKGTQGAIGNSLSHIRVWSKVAQKKPGYYMVLEDDVCSSKHWFEKSKDQLFDKIKNDFQFLYLGDCWREGYEDLTGYSPTQGSQKLIRDYTYCLHAYIITPAFGMAIDSLCRNPSQRQLFPLLTIPTDKWLPKFLIDYKISWWIYKKPLIIQINELESDIPFGDDRWDIDPETQNLQCAIRSKRRSKRR